MIYGSLGIPLLLFTISQTGKQLASTTLNTLIIVRHYCFTLPAYYLCCSFSPYKCFKSLAWCCCCCCCCCRFLLFCLNDKFFNKRIPKKQTTSSSSMRPRLILAPKSNRKRKQQQQQLRTLTRGGATVYAMKNQNQVINKSYPQLAKDQLEEDDSMTASNNQQKSVRFFNSTNRKSDDDIDDLAAKEFQEEDENENNFYYSSAIFKTSLILLMVYFLLGAYYYSKNHNVSLVDSMFDCYSMLSMSKLPDSFYSPFDNNNNNQPLLSKWDSMKFYNSLKLNPTKNPKQLVIEQLQKERSPLSGTLATPLSQQQQPEVAKSNNNIIFDQLTLDLLYLIVGLNLVSMCAHFARLCYSKNKRKLETEEEFLKENENDGLLVSKSVSQCNGYIPTVMGSFENGKLFRDLHQQPANTTSASSGTQFGLDTNTQYIYPPTATATATATATNDMISNQQQQQPINVAELFVVNQQQEQQQQSSPIEAAYSSSSFNTNNHAQIASDVSFASDRSTGSLCLHHQQQQQQQQAQLPSSSSTTTTTTTLQQAQTSTSTFKIQQQPAGSELETPSRLVMGSNQHIHHLFNNNNNTYNSGTLPLRQQHCDNNNSILPQLYTTNDNNNHHHHLISSNNNGLELDDDMDSNEMDRMLKTCLRKGTVNKQQQLIPIRSSSSSVQLSQLHNHHLHHQLNNNNNSSIVNININGDHINHNNNNNSSSSSNSLYTTNQQARIGFVAINNSGNNGTLQRQQHSNSKNKTIRVRMAPVVSSNEQSSSISPIDLNGVALIEQDRSSLNTLDTNTSNTISSSVSSRTIKLASNQLDYNYHHNNNQE